MVLKLALAAFLLAHAAIHLGYLPRPPVTAGGPTWPFDFERSWAVRSLRLDSGLARTLGLALMAVVIASFAVAALASLGWLSASVWTFSVALGAIASGAMLLIWFHPWLLIGLAIDVLLVWLALMEHWTPERLG